MAENIESYRMRLSPDKSDEDFFIYDEHSFYALRLMALSPPIRWEKRFELADKQSTEYLSTTGSFIMYMRLLVSGVHALRLTFLVKDGDDYLNKLPKEAFRTKVTEAFCTLLTDRRVVDAVKHGINSGPIANIAAEWERKKFTWRQAMFDFLANPSSPGNGYFPELRGLSLECIG